MSTELKGPLTEFGVTRKEDKDGMTESTYKLKTAEKGDFSLTVASWDKKLMDGIKTDGLFVFSPSETEVTITIQFKVRKEKYDSDTENVSLNTGNPWFTVKKVVESAKDIKDLLTGDIEIKFA
jgi:hypothetical protein